MGFSVYYHSTRPVTGEEAQALREHARRLSTGRTWLSCEPPTFFSGDSKGMLVGGSKPNFLPHPGDVATAERDKRPDGTLNDLIDILCTLSREHRVDWEITHDFGPVGHIIRGQPDAEVRGTLDELSRLPGLLAGFDGWSEDEFGDDGDEDFSPRLRLWSEEEEE